MLVNNNFLSTTVGLSSAELREKEQLEASFAEYLNLDEPTPEEVISKITKNGVQSLLEHKIEMMKKKITEQVMAAKGVTQSDLEAMKPEEQLAVLKAIMEEVQQMLKQAINEQMKKEYKTELGFMDAPVDTQGMREILAAQEYANAS